MFLYRSLKRKIHSFPINPFNTLYRNLGPVAFYAQTFIFVKYILAMFFGLGARGRYLFSSLRRYAYVNSLVIVGLETVKCADPDFPSSMRPAGNFVRNLGS